MQPARSMASARAVATALALGMVLLVVGWLAARGALPEWRQATLPERAAVEARFAELAHAAGIPPGDGAADLRLATDSRALSSAFDNLGSHAGAWLVETGCALPIEASERVPGGAGVGASALTIQ